VELADSKGTDEFVIQNSVLSNLFLDGGLGIDRLLAALAGSPEENRNFFDSKAVLLSVEFLFA
jgi:hypothetical protein